MTGTPPQPGDIVRIRDEKWRIVRCIRYDGSALIEAAGCDTTNRAGYSRFLLPFEAADRLSESSAPRVVSPQRWRHLARRVLAEATPSWTSLRAAAQADLTLLPFQLEPVMALTRGGCRFLIADAVGLGKTIQAGLMIAETLERRADARVLVISPAGLRDQWRDELRRRFRLDVDVFDAGGVAHAAAHLPPGMNPWSVRPVVITSIDFIKRPEIMRSLEALAWDLVVFDEAHNLAGRSDRASAAATIGSRARVLVLLTATPHSGNDEAFGRLCTVGNLSGAHPLLLFRRSRADVGVATSRRSTLLRVRTTPAEAAMHLALAAYARLAWHPSRGAGTPGARLAMSVLARRACSSADSLARSVERRIQLLTEAPPAPAPQIDLPFADGPLADEEPEASLRSPGLSNAAEERVCLRRLLDLARAAVDGESKLEALHRLISRTTEPAIIFTEYRDTLQRLALSLQGIDSVQLHGGLASHERAGTLRRFTEGGARLLLATDAASEGLNLHHRCRLVINLELPWTPLRLEQRAGRVDRIGQARKVHVIHLVAAGTCEESTLARLAHRIDRIRDAVGSCGPLPDQRRVADSALGNHPLPDIGDARPAPPHGSVLVDLRREACEEANRLARSRRWRAANTDAGSRHTDTRPVITRLRPRRGMTAGRRCFWAFRMTVTNASGHVVWDPLVPVAADLLKAPGRRSSSIRLILDPHHPAIEDAIGAAQGEILRRLADMFRPPLALWAARERDLMATIRDDHARLSASLLQGSLFDRRSERLAASRAALLDEALSRCGRRLHSLVADEHLRGDTCDLVFAVVVE